ncbi:MAG: hypothetical protein CMJ36_04375 [Phycisphaerae bacterium]|nr:hypothetical protein [Phycisphaerae bacterium]
MGGYCMGSKHAATWVFDIPELPEGSVLDSVKLTGGRSGATTSGTLYFAWTPGQNLTLPTAQGVYGNPDASTSIYWSGSTYSHTLPSSLFTSGVGGRLMVVAFASGDASVNLANSGAQAAHLKVLVEAEPTPPGACCLGSGGCAVVELHLCDYAGGTFLGEDTTCSGYPCAMNDAFAGLSYTIVGTDLVDDPEPTWTIDVYAELAEGCRLDAVAGDHNMTKMVSTTGSFYQNPYGGPTSTSINPALFKTFPDLRYDSFVTIGRTDQVDNALSNIGIDFSAFEAGGAIDSGDGSWYVTPEDLQGAGVGFIDELCEPGNGVHVARLTVRGMDSSVMFEALFQGKDATGLTWQMPASLSITHDDCMSPCPGDVDGSQSVDVVDLLAIISAWGPCSGCDEDIDGNGAVDVSDLLAIISAWGPCS